MALKVKNLDIDVVVGPAMGNYFIPVGRISTYQK